MKNFQNGLGKLEYRVQKKRGLEQKYLKKNKKIKTSQLLAK